MSPTAASVARSVLLASLIGLLFVTTVPPIAGATASDDLTSTCGSSVGATIGAGSVPATLSIETFVAANASYSQLTSPAALRSARANGMLVPASQGVDWTDEDAIIGYRDVTVHRIALSGNATGLADRLEANGRSPTEQFRGLVANGTVGFEYWGPSACPPELALNATIDRGAIRVLPDPANDTVALVLDTDRLLYHPLDGGEPTTDTRVYGHHRLELSLPRTGAEANGNIGAETGYDVRPAQVELGSQHDGLVRVEARSAQRLPGRTTLAPGTELTVGLVPYVGSDEIKLASTIVDRNRTFNARFNLSEADNGAIYALHVESVTPQPAVQAGVTIVAVGNASGAIVAAQDQRSDGTIFYGPSITTTHGGFVTVRNASGGLIGISEYRDPGAAVAQIDLQPALQTGQRVTVAVYRDANGNRALDAGDEPYRVNGSPVQDSARVELKKDDKPTSPPSPSLTSGAVTSVGTTTQLSSPTSPGQPGFGLVLAVLAITVAMSIRLRVD